MKDLMPKSEEFYGRYGMKLQLNYQILKLLNCMLNSRIAPPQTVRKP